MIYRSSWCLMISCNFNLWLRTRAGQPIKDGFHIRPASQSAMGTIAQSAQSIYNEYNSPAGQSVYNEVIIRPACQSTMAIIFNIRPASWSTMDLLMDRPVYLQWVWKQPASWFKTGHRPDRVAVRWGIVKQGGQSEMRLIHWSVWRALHPIWSGRNPPTPHK